ncbi:MAG: MFS transporter [Frankiaceae bacterium]
MAGVRRMQHGGQGERVRLSPRVARLVVLVSAVVAADTIFYAALAPLLPYYQRAAGLTETGAGVLVAAYAAGTLVGALPSGALVARVGARPGLLVGLALMSVSSVVFGFASNIAWLLVTARFVQGIGGAASWAAGLAWLAAAAPAERRGELLGTAFGAAVAGALLGPVVGAVADQVGTAWTFSTAAVLGAGLGIWSLLVGSSEHAPKRLREALPALRARRVRLGLVLIVVSGVAYGVVEVLAPLQLDAAGATALFISATFLLAAVLATVASPVVGRLSDIRGPAWPTRLSLAGIIGLSALAAVVTPLWPLAVIFVVGLPFFDALMVPTMAAVSDGAEAAGLHQGLAFALVNFAWAGGMTVAAAGSGAMAQAAGDWLPYLCLVWVCLASWAAAGRLGTRPTA